MSVACSAGLVSSIRGSWGYATSTPGFTLSPAPQARWRDHLIVFPAPIDVPPPRLSRKRRLAYAAIIYLGFLALLAGVEIVTRLTMPHISSLSLFVVTSQQKAQVA